MLRRSLYSSTKTDCEYESGTSILTKYTASTGVVTNFTYESGTHNLLTTTSAGVTSANTYNAMGLVTETVTHDSGWALAQQSSAVYDTFGRNTSSTDVNNITTTNTYYNYFPKSTQTGGGAVQNYDYNSANGRLNSTSIASVATQHNVYAQGMLTRLARQSGATTSTDWQSYQFGYDSFGNMLSVSVSDAAKTGSASNSRTLATYSYGNSVNNGLLQSMAYGNGDTVSYEYDIFDRTTKETYNNGVTYNYAYDASGALAKQWSSTGEEYCYEYDSLGRLVRSGEYENSGGENSERSFVQRTEHIYDESDRLTRQAWYNGSGATSQTYDYSKTTGLLTELGVYYPGNIYNGVPGSTNNPNVKIAYGYNALNMLSGKTVSADGGTLYSTSYTYNTFQAKPQRIATTNQVSKLSYGGSLPELTRQYTYDNRGNIASEQVGGQTYSYEYDARNQLKTVKNGSTTLHSYTYDYAGNIVKKIDGSTTHNYTYGDNVWADLLTKYDGIEIKYDNVGNPTKYYNGSNYTFTWQQGRQLATVTTDSANISYVYDMAGVRSSKTVGSTTYKFDTLGGKVMRQSWGNNVIDFVYDESGRPFAMRYKDLTSNIYNTYYYALNVQGDVVGLLNSIGVLIAEYSYDPWGKLLNIKTWGDLPGEDEWYLSVAETNPLRYRGYYYDTETGFYYLQSRYYDPAIGRFINADAFASTDILGLLSTNMFAYCENNPISRFDPTGELFWDVLDWAMAAMSWNEFLNSPSWEGAGWALLDTLALVPGAPSLSYPRRGADAIDAIRDINKSLDVIKSTASTLPRGNNYVYYSRNSQGIIDYVGITNNFSRREAEWARKGRNIEHFVDGVDRTSARYVEQAVIDTFGMKKNGGLLDNKINSIAPKPTTRYNGYISYFQLILDTKGGI